MSPVRSATAAICSFLVATSSTTFNADVGQQSGRSSRPFWYFLRGALSNYTGMRASPLVHYTLATRLAETKNRPSGFDYMRLILALGVIWSHSRLLTNDWGNISPLFAHISEPFVAFLLPMFFALSGFLVAGSLERSDTLVTFLGLRVFRIMPALTVEVLLSALVLGPLLTTIRYSIGFLFHSLGCTFSTCPETFITTCPAFFLQILLQW
jgi:peptidoglycan/LPS O-acetylase OafA/YrhL